jgi:hypothetical protein
MNMMKKFAYGLSAFGLAASLVACGGDGGSSTPITVDADGAGKWKINGTLTAEEDIADVTFSLYKGETQIEGAIFAYTVKDIKADSPDEALLELNYGAAADGVQGLDATIYQSDMSDVCGESDKTVELTVKVSGWVIDKGAVTGSMDTVEIAVDPVAFTVTCATEATESGSEELTDAEKQKLIDDLNKVTGSAALVESSFELGGAIAATGSSLDFDAGTVYTSKGVTATVANAIDLIYSGTAIMTPIGTQSMNYMTKKYMTSTSAAMIFAISDTDAAKAATKVEDLSAFINVDNALDYVDGLSANKYYLVVSSEAKPYLISITTVDGVKQILTIKSQGQAIK